MASHAQGPVGRKSLGGHQQPCLLAKAAEVWAPQPRLQYQGLQAGLLMAEGPELLFQQHYG